MPENYKQAVLTDSPVLYLRLGETSGTTAYDLSENELHGTYQETPTLGAAGVLRGDVDKAVTLDGIVSSEHITVPDHAALDTGDVFSLEAWVKITNLTNSPTIFSKGNTSYRLFVDTAGVLTLMKSGTGNIVASTTALSTGTWYHVVATKNGSTVKLYLNGVDVSGAVTDATIANTTGDLFIGRNSGSANYFTGTMDEAAVYSTALSAARVLDHYDAGISNSQDTLAALIAFLKANTGVSAQVSTRVYGLELPVTVIKDMPQKSVVLRMAGGPSNQDDVPLERLRIDVFNYGKTGVEARAVYLATHDAFKQLRRVTQGDTLLHMAHRSSGPISLRDPQGDWPLILESWTITAAENYAA